MLNKKVFKLLIGYLPTNNLPKALKRLFFWIGTKAIDGPKMQFLITNRLLYSVNKINSLKNTNPKKQFPFLGVVHFIRIGWFSLVKFSSKEFGRTFSGPADPLTSTISESPRLSSAIFSDRRYFLVRSPTPFHSRPQQTCAWFQSYWLHAEFQESQAPPLLAAHHFQDQYLRSCP